MYCHPLHPSYLVVKSVSLFPQPLFQFFFGVTFGLTWRGGAIGRALDLLSTGRVFKFYSGQSCVTTLGKLFTPMCFCHQAV